jgi:hypothetical protein
MIALSRALGWLVSNRDGTVVPTTTVRILLRTEIEGNIAYPNCYNLLLGLDTAVLIDLLSPAFSHQSKSHLIIIRKAHEDSRVVTQAGPFPSIIRQRPPPSKLSIGPI